jgi:hypothetical protein
MRLPYWFPSPTAWLSALILLLLIGGLGVCMRAVLSFGTSLSTVSPRLTILFGMLSLLCPIALIALAHHLLQVFLDRFFPDTRSIEIEGAIGAFPSLMSWWEGLYGWLVIILSTIISIGILGTIYYSYNFLYELNNFLNSWDKLKHLLTLPSIAWIIVAASLYQFESLVRGHLITAGRS